MVRLWRNRYETIICDLNRYVDFETFFRYPCHGHVFLSRDTRDIAFSPLGSSQACLFTEWCEPMLKRSYAIFFHAIRALCTWYRRCEDVTWNGHVSTFTINIIGAKILSFTLVLRHLSLWRNFFRSAAFARRLGFPLLLLSQVVKDDRSSSSAADML